MPRTKEKKALKSKKPVDDVSEDEEMEETPVAKATNGKGKATKSPQVVAKQSKPVQKEESESEDAEDAEDAEDQSESDAEESPESAEEEEEAPIKNNKRKSPSQESGSDEKRQKTSDPDARTVFIGRISDSVDDDKVKEFFSEVGEVESIRWKTDFDGNFKGCGWVVFTTEEAVQGAMALNNQEFEGRNINIDVAFSRSNNNAGGAGGEPSATVFIKNFGSDVDEEALLAAVSEVAEPAGHRLSKDENGVLKGFGHFDFADAETAQKVIAALNGSDFNGSTLEASESRPRNPAGGRGGFGGGRGGRGGGFGGGRGGGFGGGRGGGFGGGRGGRGGGFGGGRGGGGFGGGRGGRGGGFGGGRGGGGRGGGGFRGGRGRGGQ